MYSLSQEIHYETKILCKMLQTNEKNKIIMMQVQKLKILLQEYFFDIENVFGDVLKTNIIVDDLKAVKYFNF